MSESAGEEYRKKLYTKYFEFVGRIDYTNLEEKLFKAPNEKGFWANTLQVEMQKLNKLKIQRRAVIKEEAARLMEDKNFRWTGEIENSVKTCPKVIEISDAINDQELTVNFVENLYKSVQYIAKDFDNIIVWHKVGQEEVV